MAKKKRSSSKKPAAPVVPSMVVPSMAAHVPAPTSSNLDALRAELAAAQRKLPMARGSYQKHKARAAVQAARAALEAARS